MWGLRSVFVPPLVISAVEAEGVAQEGRRTGGGSEGSMEGLQTNSRVCDINSSYFTVVPTEHLQAIPRNRPGAFLLTHKEYY